MFLSSIHILFEDPVAFIGVFLNLIATAGLSLTIAITVHEFSHAALAHSLGDLTPMRLGRLSLNPIRHLDPMGTAMLILVGFGWGKPVPVNPYNMRVKYNQGMSLVAAAGPAANIFTALVCAVPIRLGIVPWHSPFAARLVADQNMMSFVADLLGFVIFFNIILAVFNLLPLSPLDGSKVAIGVLPPHLSNAFLRLETMGPVILLGIIMIDWITNLNLLWGVLRPMVDVIGLIVLGRPM